MIFRIEMVIYRLNHTNTQNEQTKDNTRNQRQYELRTILPIRQGSTEERTKRNDRRVHGRNGTTSFGSKMGTDNRIERG